MERARLMFMHRFGGFLQATRPGKNKPWQITGTQHAQAQWDNKDDREMHRCLFLPHDGAASTPQCTHVLVLARALWRYTTPRGHNAHAALAARTRQSTLSNHACSPSCPVPAHVLRGVETACMFPSRHVQENGAMHVSCVICLIVVLRSLLFVSDRRWRPQDGSKIAQ